MSRADFSGASFWLENCFGFSKKDLITSSGFLLVITVKPEVLFESVVSSLTPRCSKSSKTESLSMVSFSGVDALPNSEKDV